MLDFRNYAEVRMPRSLSALTIFLLAMSSPALVRAQFAPCPPPEISYQPGNPAYQDATKLRQTLESRGVTVFCIFETKLSSRFLRDKNGTSRFTLEGEACIRTKYGDISAFFVPRPQTFAFLKIKEHYNNGGYLYTFSGMPDVWLLNELGSAGRVYYYKRDNYLLSISDSPTRVLLERVLDLRPLSL